MDVSYTFVGEGDVDGAACNIVNASFGGSNIKLYLSKASSLPVMVSYQGHAMPKVMHFKTKAPEGAVAEKDVVMFTHKVDAPELVEYNVRFFGLSRRGWRAVAVQVDDDRRRDSRAKFST